MKRIASHALLASLLLPLCACQVGTIPDDEFDRKYGDRLKGPGGQSMFYGTEATVFAQTLRSQLGADALVTSLSLQYKNATFDAQAPGDPTRKLGYRYEDGSFDTDEASDPISTSEAGNFFKVSEVPLEKLPDLVKTAHAALGEKERYVRMVNISMDRYYLEYQAAKSAAGAGDDARLRREYLGPEASAEDKGIRLMFLFGESGASSSVELDATGRVVSVRPADVVSAGSPARPEPVPTLLDAVGVLAAAHRLEIALGAKPLMLTDVGVYPGYTLFTVVDPNDPGRTERHDFRDGQFGRANMERARGNDDDPPFTLAQANLAALDIWVKVATEAAGPNAVVKYLSVEHLRNDTGPSVMVHMEADGRSMWAKLKTDGSLVKLHD